MIKSYDFNIESKDKVVMNKKFKDWPVVYLINNSKLIYVGETNSIDKRLMQHLKFKKDFKLERIHVVFDSEFNKSATLDIEQNLIQLCNADQKFELINQNNGHLPKYNYYQRELYINKVAEIWNGIYNLGLANKTYIELKNTDLFKYSPYNTLTQEQDDVAKEVVLDMLECFTNNVNGTSVICGGAGTGKTILAISLIFKILSASDNTIDLINTEYYESNYMMELRRYIKEKGNLDIAFVIPMTSLRKTISKVFRLTKNGLKSSMVIGPSEVSKKKYDLLIVDEAHRLSRRKNLTGYNSYDNVNKLLELNEDSTQLDWIKKQSKYCVLFYDKAQSVKGSDITEVEFNETLNNNRTLYHYLETQMRCASGKEYTDYINSIFNCDNIEFEFFSNFRFKLYQNISLMEREIKKLNNEVGLCRMVSGYSWVWKTKNMSLDEIANNNVCDIEIENSRYIWNMQAQEWILRENSINEIGCIHTVQGYDLNYVGVIFGREIDYDFDKKELVIYKDLFMDKKVKAGVEIDTLKAYIINSYKVMLTRGIKGCFVYVCNKNLRKYLSRFIEVI